MWLGYPGTSGASFMDYIITDSVTSPMRFEKAYSEKLAYMPHTFFIGDHAQMMKHLVERVILKDKSEVMEKDNLTLANATPSNLQPLLSRAEVKEHVREVEVVHGPEKELIKTEVVVPVVEVPATESFKQMIGQGLSVSVVDGVPIQNGITQTTIPVEFSYSAMYTFSLPESAIVFCNFNQLYKIDPSTLDMWAEILKKVPDSILWLLRFPGLGEPNIQRYFTERGIDQTRIVFSNVAPKEEHVRRGQLADICLDTPLCNGHTTGMDILWTGTPMITMPLETLASRIASSQLYALGVPELVARDRRQYVSIATRLANDRKQLAVVRAKVWKARTTSTLFDVKQYCRDIETLFHTMWKKYEKGHPIDHITEHTANPCDI